MIGEEPGLDDAVHHEDYGHGVVVVTYEVNGELDSITVRFGTRAKRFSPEEVEVMG